MACEGLRASKCHRNTNRLTLLRLDPQMLRGDVYDQLSLQEVSADSTTLRLPSRPHSCLLYM